MNQRITTESSARKEQLQIHDHDVDPFAPRSGRITAWGAFLPLTLITLLLTGCVAATDDDVSAVDMPLGEETGRAYDDCLEEVGDMAYCASFLCSAPEWPEPPRECWFIAPPREDAGDPDVGRCVRTPRESYDCGDGRGPIQWCPAFTYPSEEACKRRLNRRSQRPAFVSPEPSRYNSGRTLSGTGR